jgi:hypothetical protein
MSGRRNTFKAMGYHLITVITKEILHKIENRIPVGEKKGEVVPHS